MNFFDAGSRWLLFDEHWPADSAATVKTGVGIARQRTSRKGHMRGKEKVVMNASHLHHAGKMSAALSSSTTNFLKPLAVSQTIQ
jgi:hypothetical protein